MRRSKYQKGWGSQKGGESNIKGGVFFSFLSRYCTKREISRIKLMTVLLL